ncbi:MAG: glycosyltransferase [Saprospiraceae bacterium]
MEKQNALNVQKPSKKLWYISWMIPPSQGGSSYITHQLAKNFESQEIVVLGGSRKLFQGSKFYDGVLYHYFFTELNWKGHGDRFFFLPRLLLFPIFVLNLFKLAKTEKPVAILTSFPDAFFLFASWLVARFFKIKLFSYFHNTYVDNRHGFSKWIAEKIQSKVFSDSSLIFVMSDGMKDYYKLQYPEYAQKIATLPHTFDVYPKDPDSKVNFKSTPPFRLILIGTFNNSNIEATGRLLKLLSKHRDTYLVDIYTSTNKNILKLKWGLDLDALGINHRGFVKQENVNALFENYDVCLLTHGFTGEYTEVEYQTIFPTRTIPLLLSGKPILAHSPLNSFLTNFIQKFDCAELVTEPSELSLLNGLLRVTEDSARKHQLILNAKVAAHSFYGPTVVKNLKKLLGLAS